MSTLKLTPSQLESLADVLRKLTDISAESGVEFNPFGSLEIEFAGNTIRIGRGDDNCYCVDNYCG